MNINDFTIRIKESKNQNNTFTPSHVRYDVFLAFEDRSIKVEYQCNPSYVSFKANITDIIECVLDDAYAYMNCEDAFDFMDEFGYNDPKEAKKAYNGCKANYEKLVYLLGSEEAIEELTEIIEEF